MSATYQIHMAKIMTFAPLGALLFSKVIFFSNLLLSYGVAKETSPVLEPYRGTVGGRSHARLCQWNDVHGHVPPREDVH